MWHNRIIRNVKKEADFNDSKCILQISMTVNAYFKFLQFLPLSLHCILIIYSWSQFSVVNVGRFGQRCYIDGLCPHIVAGERRQSTRE